jgi:hypothetical protein
MVTTWIDTAAKGRQGGPVRAGMWSSVVVGTHPIAANQEVCLELGVDEQPIGPLPAYWIENKGPNSFRSQAPSRIRSSGRTSPTAARATSSSRLARKAWWATAR